MHPLAPLTTDELAAAVHVVQHGDQPPTRFVSAALREPRKEHYLAWRAGGERPAREALVVCVDAAGAVQEQIVDLAARRVGSAVTVEGARPPITPDEYAAVVRAVRTDPGFRAVLAARGISDTSLTQIDVLAPGAFGHPLEAGHRIARCVAFDRPERSSNGYARPIESLIAFVDLDARCVLAIEEIDVKPIPAADGDYRAGVVAVRDDLRPIAITQPEGVSFTIDGNVIRWHRWSLLAAIDPQEGLVLHDVRYDNRPILHRASCAEMIVPYGEPHPMHAWRTYFDAGEYGLGACVNSLALGCDCVGAIRYIDAHLIDGAGEPYAVPSAICIHEEDAGLLWKHTDELSGTVETRRARRLVVNAMVTVGNYDYAFRWNLHLDGSIEVEVQLHGIVSTMALAPGEVPAGATVVDRGLAAPNHQHLFSFRLDLDVDGTGNSVHEVEAQAVASPLGNAFTARVTPLDRESLARRDAAAERARAWHVVNPTRRNAHGGATGYRIVPQHGVSTLLAAPGSSVDERAGWARHTLWVTRFDEGERHPSGTYPFQRRPTQGLAQWSDQDRELVDTDVVVWYTVGTTHFVRPEDWPIMPVARAGFRLEPVGFFDRNPTLDVPPPSHC